MGLSTARRHELELRGTGVILRAAGVHGLDASKSDRFELGRSLRANIPPGWPPPALDPETPAELRAGLVAVGRNTGRGGWFVLEPGSGLTIPTLVGMAGFSAVSHETEPAVIWCSLVSGLVAPDLIDETVRLLRASEEEDRTR